MSRGSSHMPCEKGAVLVHKTTQKPALKHSFGSQPMELSYTKDLSVGIHTVPSRGAVFPCVHAALFILLLCDCQLQLSNSRPTRVENTGGSILTGLFNEVTICFPLERGAVHPAICITQPSDTFFHLPNSFRLLLGCSLGPEYTPTMPGQ